jgi:hypothetical protein
MPAAWAYPRPPRAARGGRSSFSVMLMRPLKVVRSLMPTSTTSGEATRMSPPSTLSCSPMWMMFFRMDANRGWNRAMVSISRNSRTRAGLAARERMMHSLTTAARSRVNSRLGAGSSEERGRSSVTPVTMNSSRDSVRAAAARRAAGGCWCPAGSGSARR